MLELHIAKGGEDHFIKFVRICYKFSVSSQLKRGIIGKRTGDVTGLQLKG